MEIIEDLSSLPDQKNTVVTVGTFDGVHLAHQAIVRRMKEIARDINGKTVLVTFFPHPCKILAPERYGSDLRIITTQEEKFRLLENYGLDMILQIPFDEDFAKMLPAEFIKEILVDKLSLVKIVAGYNHNFGASRSGDHSLLETMGAEYGFSVDKIQELIVNRETVSSTRIRRLFANGDIVIANQLLNRNYTISGMVEEGILIPEMEEKIIPAEGLYKVAVRWDNHVYQTNVTGGAQIVFEEEAMPFENKFVTLEFLENID